MAKLLKLTEAVVVSEMLPVPVDVCVELEDRDAPSDRTVGSEKEGYECPPREYPGMPPTPSRPPSLLSPPPDEGSLRSRLGWERNPGCWLAWRREEVEEVESLALPTLSSRLS